MSQGESIRVGPALGLSPWLPRTSFIRVFLGSRDIRLSLHLVKYQGLKPLHQLLPLLLDASPQDAGTPPFPVASVSPEPELALQPVRLHLFFPLSRSTFLALFQGPVCGLSPPESTSPGRARKQPENLKTGLEPSPPNAHEVPEDGGEI